MDPYAATSYLIASATTLPVYHFTLLIHDRSFGCFPEIESLSRKLLKFIPTILFIFRIYEAPLFQMFEQTRGDQ